MPDWTSYRLSDFLMFDSKTYHRLFELYNTALWPLQFVALGLGVAVVWAAWRGQPKQLPMVLVILAVVWLWVAWAFHWRHYATINLAAPWFAGGFVVEALALALAAWRWRPEAGQRPGSIGVAIVGIGLLVMPAIGPLLGRSWKSAELFGLAPDPTAVMTLGLIVAARAPVYLMVVPALWCIATWATLWAMGGWDAWLAPLAMLGAIAARLCRRPRVSETRSPSAPPP